MFATDTMQRDIWGSAASSVWASPAPQAAPPPPATTPSPEAAMLADIRQATAMGKSLAAMNRGSRRWSSADKAIDSVDARDLVARASAAMRRERSLALDVKHGTLDDDLRAAVRAGAEGFTEAEASALRAMLSSPEGLVPGIQQVGSLEVELFVDNARAGGADGVMADNWNRGVSRTDATNDPYWSGSAKASAEGRLGKAKVGGEVGIGYTGRQDSHSTTTNTGAGGASSHNSELHMANVKVKIVDVKAKATVWVTSRDRIRIQSAIHGPDGIPAAGGAP